MTNIKKYLTKIILLIGIALLSSCHNTHENKYKGLPAPELLAGYQDAISANSYDLALEYLREIEAQYPYSNYAQQAMLNTAYVYYRQNEPEKTIAAADRFIHSYPTNENVDYAYYIKGLTYYYRHQNFISRLTGSKDFSDRDQENAAKSYEAFNVLMQRFPDSQYSKDASQKIITLHDTAARHEVRIAKFYYDRGAYVAAVNRCKKVLEEFPRSLSVEDALGLMTLSYKQMQINDLYQDSLSVLTENFPQSRYIDVVSDTSYENDCYLCIF